MSEYLGNIRYMSNSGIRNFLQCLVSFSHTFEFVFCFFYSFICIYDFYLSSAEPRYALHLQTVTIQISWLL